MLKLYHGSTVAVTKPRLITPDRSLDFGCGFYLTSSYEQANRWANLTVKRRGNGTPVISVYEFDETEISHLKVLVFPSATTEWLKYVTRNRNLENYSDDHDIVIGPVANDRTMPVLRLYFAGIYSEEEALRRLLPQKLKDQYAFRTESALSFLHFSEVIDS